MQLERIECSDWKQRGQFHQSLEEYAWIVLLFSKASGVGRHETGEQVINSVCDTTR